MPNNDYFKISKKWNPYYFYSSTIYILVNRCAFGLFLYGLILTYFLLKICHFMEILYQTYKFSHYAIMKRRFRTKEVREPILILGSARKSFFKTDNRFRNRFCKHVQLVQCCRITEFILNFFPFVFGFIMNICLGYEPVSFIQKTYTAGKVAVFDVILVRIFSHSDWVRENTDQNNSEYGHFLRSVKTTFSLTTILVTMLWFLMCKIELDIYWMKLHMSCFSSPEAATGGVL